METVYKFRYIKKKQKTFYSSKDTRNKVKQHARAQGNLFVIHFNYQNFYVQNMLKKAT